MQMRIVSVAGALLVVLLVGVSLAGASPSSYKRYTFPAAPPYTLMSPGKLTVLLPSAWTVKTTWPPSADNAHPYALWDTGADLQPKGTTLADIRASNTWSGCRKGGWGPKVPIYEKLVGSGYMTLPVGTVYHWAQRAYSQKGCKGGAQDTVWQRFWLDRHRVSLGGQQVFLAFNGVCRIKHCPAFNRQLGVIMHSIRLLPG